MLQPIKSGRPLCRPVLAMLLAAALLLTLAPGALAGTGTARGVALNGPANPDHIEVGARVSFSGYVWDETRTPVSATVAFTASGGAWDNASLGAAPVSGAGFSNAWTAPATPGAYVLTATATAGGSSFSTNLTVHVTPHYPPPTGVPARIELTPTVRMVQPGQEVGFVGTVIGTDGNGVAWYGIDLQVVGGTPSLRWVTSGPGGTFTFRVVASAAGDPQIIVNAAGAVATVLIAPTTPTAPGPGQPPAGQPPVNLVGAVVLQAPAGVAAGSTATLSGRVFRPNGMGVAQNTVLLAFGAGAAPVSVLTQRDGSFAYQWQAPATAGMVTVTATAVIDASVVTGSAAVLVTSGVAGSLSLTPAATGVAVGGSTLLSGAVTDLQGSPMAGAVVDLSADAGQVPATVTTGADGRYQAAFTAPASPGLMTVSGAVHGSALAARAQIWVQAGPAATLTLAAAQPRVGAGARVTVSGSVSDAAGNPLPGVTVSLTATGGNLSDAALTTGAGGGFAATLAAPPQTGTVTVSAALADGKAGSSLSIAVVPGPPAALTLDTPELLLAPGAGAQLSGALHDALGNPIGGAPVRLAATAGRLNPDTLTTGADGSFRTLYHAPAAAGAVSVGAVLPGTPLAATLDLRVRVAQRPFTDLPTDHWAAAAVAELKLRDSTAGFPDGSFHPDAPVTRADLVRWLLDAAGVAPEPGESPFTDVPAGAVHAGYLRAAYRIGLLKGDGGKARPDDPLTRQEAAALLVRAAALSQPLPQPPAAPAFSDQDTIAAWAQPSVAAAAGNGLLQGDGDGSFRPQQTLTRAEAAVLVWRLHQRLTAAAGG